MNTAIIYRLLTMVLLALAGGFLLCGSVGLLNGETLTDPGPRAFGIAILISLALALLAHWIGRQGTAKLFRREALCAIG